MASYPRLDDFFDATNHASRVKASIEDLNHAIAEARAKGIIVFLEPMKAGDGEGLGVTGVKARIAGAYAEVEPKSYTPR